MRILFFSQGVSLAHVARPLTLAKQLEGQPRFEVHFARTARMARFVDLPAARQHEVAETMSPEQFVERMAWGQPNFSAETLALDVAEDFRVLSEVKPDLVIGDLRLSLQISARELRIPFTLLSNAHWSPELPLSTYPNPDHPMTTMVGRTLADPIFKRLVGLIFRGHAKPFNAVRRVYGMPPLSEMRQGYNEADSVLFVDHPGFYPTMPESRFLAPIVWEPPFEAPRWLGELKGDDQVLVSVGSTGSVRLLQDALVATLRDARLTVMMATAERGEAPAGVLSAGYVPGFQAMKKARLMVCNGGSLSTAQALAAGRPFLALCSNLDQYTSCQPLVNAGAGLVLSAADSTPAMIDAALKRLLDDRSFTESAKALQPFFDPGLAAARFQRWLVGDQRQARAA